MTTRLVSDLQWLQSQVPNGRIAVIAHSQGTGVSHAALQDSRVPVDLFVTFGAALEKLHIARQVQQNRRRLALGSTLTTAGVVLLAIAAGTWIKGDPFSGNPGSTYIAARVLIAAGAVLLLARMGLWFHLGRIGGGLLTLFGVIALITGIPLASGAKPLIDHPWYEVPLRLHQLSWSDMVPDNWHWASLVAFAFGLTMVILRELVFLRKRDRIDVEDPGSRPSSRALRRIWGVRALLDPLSAFGNFAAAGAVIFGIFCIAMSTSLDRPPEDDAIVLLITAGLAFCFAAVPIPVGGVTEPTPDDFRIPRRESRMTWHNYWASADLVPDGDLPVGAHRYVHNHEVTNRGSVLADHTSYHENTEEFLADIAGNLSRLARWPLIRQDEVGIFKRASHRRRWRVSFLSIAGWMSFIGMVTTWWVLGRAGMEPLGQPLESLLGNVVGVVPGVNAERVKQWLPAWRLGGLVIALITLFWYRIMLFQAWRYLDQVEASFVFHREPSEKAAGGLRFERAFAYSVFALSSAVGLCAAVWAPNLLRITAERLKLIESPGVCVDCGEKWMSRWPGDRMELAAFGIWEWPWWRIGVTVLLITAVESLLIFNTVRHSAKSSGIGAVTDGERVLAPAGRP